MTNAEIDHNISETVHHLYYDFDRNCAGTTLVCLSHLLHYPVGEQAASAALGMHGAGGYRAQCGLAEGGLMMLGMYFHAKGYTDETVVSLCRGYGEAFEREFGSLRCRELRPQGFAPDQPPHMCEKLTCRAIRFGYDYIADAEKKLSLSIISPKQGKFGGE